MTTRTILFLVTEDWYFASHRLPLAAAAVAAGYRVVVAARVQRHEAALRAAGCEVVPLRWRRSGDGPLQHALAIREIAALYRALRPDLVHHVALKPVVFGSIAARLSGVRRVVNAIAGLGFLASAKGVMARPVALALRLALRSLLGAKGAVTILQNPDDRAALVDGGIVHPSRTVLIRGSGVDLRAFTPAPTGAEAPLVVLVGRMLWTKGVGEFVEAATRLRAEGEKARFVLVGEPDADNPDAIARAQLQSWIDAGAVEWWGYRADIPQVLAGADVACLPSYREGVPKSLLEAAAAGLPLVATDAPGCREVVRPGENGLLVPVRDAEALAGALRTLLADRALRERLGRRSREIAEAEFSDQAVAAATLEVYRELLAR